MASIEIQYIFLYKFFLIFAPDVLILKKTTDAKCPHILKWEVKSGKQDMVRDGYSVCVCVFRFRICLFEIHLS